MPLNSRQLLISNRSPHGGTRKFFANIIVYALYCLAIRPDFKSQLRPGLFLKALVLSHLLESAMWIIHADCGPVAAQQF